MPDVIHLHSALTPGRDGDVVTAGRTHEGRHRLLRAQRLDVLPAMGRAGLVTAALLFTGRGSADTLEGVHAGLGDLLGPGAALVVLALGGTGRPRWSARRWCSPSASRSRWCRCCGPPAAAT